MTPSKHAQGGQANQSLAASRHLRHTGVLLGIGLAGTVDEVVFHQLLRWHNFIVPPDLDLRLIADGLFHFGSSALLLIAALRLWRQPRFANSAVEGRLLIAGSLVGAGGFNLYDGTIQHILLRLHPVREGVANLLPYDLAWNGVALALLLVGLTLWRRE